MTELDDSTLLKKIANGDSKSFEPLFRKHQNLVYGYSMKMLKDSPKAEDITQETWMKVIKNASTFKGKESAASWIVSIARNLIIDQFRAQKKWADFSDEDWSSIPDPTPDIEKMFMQEDFDLSLKTAFDELPENQKVILAMVLIEELSQSEIAERLQISVGAVKSTVFRAKENLKSYFQKKEGFA